MTGEEIFNQALVIIYLAGIFIMLYIGWRDK
jgi:preprotein translocase subunit SecF